jgi:hypothetical protein
MNVVYLLIQVWLANLSLFSSMTVKTKIVGKCVVDKFQVFRYMIYHTDSEACIWEAKANKNTCASYTDAVCNYFSKEKPVPSIQTMSSSSYKVSKELVKSLPLSLSHAKCSDHFTQPLSQTFKITNITQNELDFLQSRIQSLCVCVWSVGVQGCWH